MNNAYVFRLTDEKLATGDCYLRDNATETKTETTEPVLTEGERKKEIVKNCETLVIR